MNSVKKLRERGKFTQKRVAKEIGIAPSTVAKLGPGDTLSRVDKPPTLAREFDCVVDEL